MPLDRRRFLVATGMSVAATALARPASTASPQDWAWVRDQFDLRRDLLHFASFYLVSHPRPVREAIETLRRALDENPFEVVDHGLFTRPDEVRRAAAVYLGGRPEDVALTRSTTEGLALIYAGLRLRSGQEILTTAHDHYVHHESIRLAAQRDGAEMRRVALYDEGSRASEDEIVDRLRRAVRPGTRVIGVTWVHSSTGVKLPIRSITASGSRTSRRPTWVATSSPPEPTSGSSGLAAPRSSGDGARPGKECSRASPPSRCRPTWRGSTGWSPARPREPGCRRAASTRTSICGRCPPPSPSTARSGEPGSPAASTR